MVLDSTLFDEDTLTRTNSVMDDVVDKLQIMCSNHTKSRGESIVERTLCHIGGAGGTDFANIVKCHRESRIIARDKALLPTVEELNV